MSGGSLNYAYHKINDIIIDIQEADVYFQNNELSIDQRQKVVEEIQNIEKELTDMSLRVKHLEWWLSSDYNDQSYYSKIK